MSKKKRTRIKKVDPPSIPALTSSRNWILGLILGVTFLTFANSLFNGFAYDDKTFILENQLVRSLANIPTVLTNELWFYRVLQDKDPNKETGPTTPYYRPTFSIFQMICWQLFQDKPGGWHLINILVHMLAVYFVFLIVERITKDLKLSAIATLLFAIHPLRVESVAWICGISDPFLAVFLLPSFYLYMRYREEGKAKLLTASLALFLLAAFTKEPAVALPIFIGVYELFIINRDKMFRERIKPAIIYSASFLVVAAAYFAARYYALGFALNNADFKSYPLQQVLLTIPLVIWKYIGLLFWPVELSLFHATYMVKNPLDLQFILPFAGLVALALALWRLRNNIVARFAILWFVVHLLPVLNLSAFGEEFLVQERYVYIPSAGFSLLVGMALARIPLERWLRSVTDPDGRLVIRTAAQVAVVGLLVLVLAVRSFAHNSTWQDDETLWRHGAETAPDQTMPHYILGHRLLTQRKYQEAVVELEEFLKLSPNNLIVIANITSAYSLIYQYQAASNPGHADPAPLYRAVELCERGLNISDQVPMLWDTLGTVYTYNTNLKNYDRAVACFHRGLDLNPKNPVINFHLGVTLVLRGDYDGGLRFLQIALAEAPEIADAHKSMALAYRGKGQFKEAIDQFTLYLQLQPNAPDASMVSKEVQALRAQLQTSSPQS